jgi:protocatechuate 3,4-dioxygenase beta subunit
MMNQGPYVLSVVLALTLADLPPVPAPADTTHPVYPWATPTSWDIAIARDDEPGPRFIMSGRILGPDSLPARGVDVYVYHADIQGYYARKRSQMNRLAGVLRTNERGEYRVRSALPGQYEAAAHIHFDIWKDGHPQRSTFVNLYTPLETPPVASWPRQKTASQEWNSHMAIITVDSAGVYWCHHDIRTGDMYVMPASYDSTMRELRKKVEKAQHN